MANIKLVASTYYLSSSTYLSVSNASNMYDDTDSTTYATVTNSQSGTTSYYIYLRGFDFDSIPSNAVITSWSVNLKARESGVSTSTSYAPKLCHGTSQITSTCSALTTTASVHTFTGVDADWDDIVNYGDDFGIRINCRRANRNTTGYVYIYGAEIEVEYTVPNPATVTSTLTGNGTIVPAGVTNTSVGAEYEITITPADTSQTVTATKNGEPITLTPHYAGSTDSSDLGSYALVSGGFNGSGASYFQGLVGKGANGSQTTSNYYSSGSGTIAVFTYNMGITVPSNAVIERVWCEVNGHAESTSQSSEYMCAQLISGNTDLSEELNFKSIGTSNSTQTLEATTLPTVSQLAAMKLQCRLGYYGGAINGATVHVTYSVPGGNPTHYTYSYTVDGNATIAVTIGGSGEVNKLYVKRNGAWVEVAEAYKKVNGVWVLQSDLTTVFSSTAKYINGD